MCKAYRKNEYILSNIYAFMAVKQHSVRDYIAIQLKQYTSEGFLPHSTLCAINNSNNTQSNEMSASGLVIRV